MKIGLPAGFWRGFGPGLMWAAAAIGVSAMRAVSHVGLALLAITTVIYLATRLA